MLNTLLVCAALWTQGGAGAVRLEPGVCSLAQLARALSAQGVAAHCELSITNRLALLCLKDHPWERLRPLLERGLELRITKQANGVWNIALDPETAAREKVLRDRFVQRYETGLNDIVNRAWSAADEIRRMEPLERDKRMQELRAIIGLPGMPGGTPAEQEFADLVLSMAGASSGGGNSSAGWLLVRRPFGLAGLLNAPAAREYTLADVANQSEEATQLRQHLGIAPLSPQEQGGGNGGAGQRGAALLAGAPDPSQAHIATRLVFDPLTFMLAENVNIAAGTPFMPGTYHVVGRGHFDYVGQRLHLPFAMRDIFREAGQEDALTRRERSTEEWLDVPDRRQMLTLDAGERTLSSAVQKWSLQAEREVIMEVSAQRDILPGWRAIVPNLTLNMYRALQSGQPPAPDDAATPLPDSANQANRFLRATPFVESTGLPLNMRVWTAAQADDVSLIHNELSFLDNAAPRDPTAALYLLSRRAQNPDHLPAPEDLLAASRLLSPGANARNARSTLYNGLGEFSLAYPMMRLWDASPQREQALKDLVKNNVAYIECRYSRIADLTAFTETVRGLAMACPADPHDGIRNCLYSDYPAWVRQAVLVIQSCPSDLGTGKLVTFTLTHLPPREAGEKYQMYYPLWGAIVGPLAWPAPPDADAAKRKP